MSLDSLSNAISQYGFPIIGAVGMGFIIWYVWQWVTKEVKPMLGQSMGTLIGLIDRIRMLDNDMIRLDQKINTIMELREKQQEKERKQ